MVFRTYTTTDGKQVDVNENGLDEWGLPHNCRVRTDQGLGRIMGSFDQEFFVLLDANEKTKEVSVFHLENIGDTVTTESCEPPPPVKMHPLKTIIYKGNTVRIVMQRKAGPCPIFAIANALALQGKIKLLPDLGTSIRETTLNQTLADYFRASVVADLPPLEPPTSTSSPPPATTGKADAAGLSAVPVPVTAPQATSASACPSSSQVGIEGQEQGQDSADPRSACSSVVLVPPLSVTDATISTNTIASIGTASSITVKGKNSGEANGVDQVSSNPLPASGAAAGAPPQTQGEDPAGSSKDPIVGGVKENTLSHFLANPVAVEGLKRQFAAPNVMNDFIDSLYAGMDVDVVFSGVEDFMMDRCVALFPLFGLRLFHGWVIGESMSPYEKLQFFSYNELTTVAVSSPLSETDLSNNANAASAAADADANAAKAAADRMAKWELVLLSKDFYSTTNAFQMTMDGFLQLCQRVPESVISVLFWQNHFFTCTKNSRGQLLVLLTDESYLHRKSFVFSTISYPHFALEEFLDGDGKPVNQYVAYVTANAGDDFSTEEIDKMRMLLQRQYADSPTPQEVLDALVLEKNKPRKAKTTVRGILKNALCPTTTITTTTTTTSSSQSNDATTTKEDAIDRFVDILPDVNRLTAQKFLMNSNYDVGVAVEKYFQSLS